MTDRALGVTRDAQEDVFRFNALLLNKNQYYKENNLKPSVLCLGPSRTSPPVSNQKQDYRSKSESL